jgi:hypothetical protein
MTVTVGDILKIVAVMSWDDGNIFQNVFSVLIEGGTGPFDNIDVVDDMEDWLDDMYDNFGSRIVADLAGSELRVYVYDSGDEDFDEIGSGVWDQEFTNVGVETARGVALLINAKTTDADVSGKKYIGGLVQTTVQEGIWEATSLAAAVLFGVDWTTAFVGALSAAEFTPGVWSPTRLAFLPFSGTEIIPTIPAYQRRRKQGVGI